MRLCFPIEKRKTAFCQNKTSFFQVCGSLLENPSSIPLRYGHEWFFIRFFKALIDRVIFDYNCYGPASMNPMRPMNNENCVFPFSSFLTMEFQKR